MTVDPRLLERIQALTARFTLREGEPTARDARAFASLFNSVYSRTVTEDYYLWQFCRSPLGGGCVLAEHEGDLVATYGLRPLKMFAGEECLIGLTVDLMITPAARRTGLMSRLEGEIEQRARGRGCVAIYATPNAQAYRPRVQRLGWASMGQVSTYWAETRSHAWRPGRLRIVPVKAFDRAIDGIYRQFVLNHHDLAIVQRDHAYLNWRYAQNPWYSYDLFVVCEGEAVVGYLVLKLFRDPTSGEAIGDIVDWLWQRDDAALLEEVLRFALFHFAAMGVARAAAWFETNTLADRLGGELGFWPSDQKRYLTCKPLSPRHAWLGDRRRWFLTMGDSEIA